MTSEPSTVEVRGGWGGRGAGGRGAGTPFTQDQPAAERVGQQGHESDALLSELDDEMNDLIDLITELDADDASAGGKL